MAITVTNEHKRLDALAFKFGVGIPTPSYSSRQMYFFNSVSNGTKIQNRLDAVGGASNLEELIEKEKQAVLDDEERLRLIFVEEQRILQIQKDKEKLLQDRADKLKIDTAKQNKWSLAVIANNINHALADSILSNPVLQKERKEKKLLEDALKEEKRLIDLRIKEEKIKEEKLLNLSNLSEELESFYEIEPLEQFIEPEKLETLESIISLETNENKENIEKPISLETTAPILAVLGIGLVSYYLLKDKK